MTALQCLSVGFLAVFCVSLTQCSMLGQPTDDVDMNDPFLQKAYQFMVTDGAAEINKKSNSMYYMMVSRIVDDDDHPVKKQLVNGLNFFFTVELKPTNCRKGEDLSSCKISDKENSHATQWCDVEVYVTWGDSVSFLDPDDPFKCYPAKEETVEKTKSKKLKYP